MAVTMRVENGKTQTESVRQSSLSTPFPGAILLPLHANKASRQAGERDSCITGLCTVGVEYVVHHIPNDLGDFIVKTSTARPTVCRFRL